MEVACVQAARGMVLACGLVFGLNAAAQTPPELPPEEPETHAEKAAASPPPLFPWDEYDKRVESARQTTALKSDLLGDQINIANGALSFSATDVAIAGNNALPVAFTRSYTVQNRYSSPYSSPVTDLMLADWDLDLPSISGSFAPDWHSRVPGNPGRRCSAPSNQVAPPSPVWDINVWDFWQGNTLT